jgi:hypothetical protein
LKAGFSQQGASSSGIPPQGANSISQPGEAEKTTGDRDSPVVRNLLLPFVEVISLGASGSGIPPQGASGSSIHVDWEPVVLEYHHGEFVVLANLWNGAGSSGTPQGADSRPADEDVLQYVAFKVDRLHLAQTKCLEVLGGSLKPGEAKLVPGAHGNQGKWHYPSPGRP